MDYKKDKNIPSVVKRFNGRRNHDFVVADANKAEINEELSNKAEAFGKKAKSTLKQLGLDTQEVQ